MYQVVVNRIPRGVKRFEEPLYHQPNHRKLQSARGWRSYYLINDRMNIVEASFHFMLKGNIAISPARAPYGGLAIKRAIAKRDLQFFLNKVLGDLRKRNIKNVTIRTVPILVNQNSAEEKAYSAAGFECIMRESSSLLPIKAGWRKPFHRSEQKRLGKCVYHHYQFQEVAIDDLKKVYTFIRNCRAKKGFSLSLRWSDVQKLKNVYPDRIKCFGVWDENKLIATALTIVVSQQTLYDFYHDHDEEYDNMSPVVMLVDGMIRWCANNKFQWIDLGTSMVGDQVNTGLHRFKLRLGALPAERKTWKKVLV